MQPSSLRLLRYALILAIFSIPALAQLVLTTLPVGYRPVAAAVNAETNNIYVLNTCGSDPNCGSTGTVTVINGGTNNTQTVNIGYGSYEGYYYFPNQSVSSPLVVDSVTNKIYAVNPCGNDSTCESAGTVTVIDGATNDTTSVQVGYSPVNAAVNSVTNRVYVTNSQDNTVTVIDGGTNNIIATVTVGHYPGALAVNSNTNKIYILTCGSYYCEGGENGTVTVIDGATNNTASVNVGNGAPSGIAVNPVTNKIYVTNGDTGPPGTITVIDGATNNTTTVTLSGSESSAPGVNSVTNRIYVGNVCADSSCYIGNVTVIDGATNNILTTINDVPIGMSVYVSVDSQINKIYFELSSNCCSPTALIAVDGATNTALTLGVGDQAAGMDVNEMTGKIYVPSVYDNTVSIVSEGAKLQFVPVTPCRVVDTRKPNGPFGGPPIQGGTYRSFPIPQGPCNIPATAIAYALNVTVVPNGPLGYLTIWPTSQGNPGTSTLNSQDGRVKADAAIVSGGVSAAVSVYASDTTNVLLDINGYFAPANSSTLAFFPLPPCRVADTRNPSGDLGGPHLTGGVTRNFPILEATSCNIPNRAQAYSLNFTAVPYPALGYPLQYLTVWPTGESQPVVSTLNNPTGTIVANAAIVPAGSPNGEIAVYPTNDTNLVIDINGYFAPASLGSNPLALYPLQACRVLDTRNGHGGEFSGELVIDVLDGNYGPCAPSDQAQAYLFNATVIPRTSLGYLTLWPDGENQPPVSTLNAVDVAITSNMAIVPNLDNFTDAYTSNLTQLLLDISGYFAP